MDKSEKNALTPAPVRIGGLIMYPDKAGCRRKNKNTTRRDARWKPFSEF